MVTMFHILPELLHWLNIHNVSMFHIEMPPYLFSMYSDAPFLSPSIEMANAQWSQCFTFCLVYCSGSLVTMFHMFHILSELLQWLNGLNVSHFLWLLQWFTGHNVSHFVRAIALAQWSQCFTFCLWYCTSSIFTMFH